MNPKSLPNLPLEETSEGPGSMMVIVYGFMSLLGMFWGFWIGLGVGWWLWK